MKPRSEKWAERVRASFARQQLLGTLGADISALEPGRVAITLPYSDKIGQQHGFVHAGALATIADSACGYAALTLMPDDAAVLSIEFKINMLAPAVGTSFRAEAHVVRAGRTITVCRADVLSADDSKADEKLVATMQATMMTVRGREGLSD